MACDAGIAQKHPVAGDCSSECRLNVVGDNVLMPFGCKLAHQKSVQRVQMASCGFGSNVLYMSYMSSLADGLPVNLRSRAATLHAIFFPCAFFIHLYPFVSIFIHLSNSSFTSRFLKVRQNHSLGRMKTSHGHLKGG